MADDVAGRSVTPLQKAFAVHLRKVARALHDLEWVWSGDMGEGDEIEAISAVVSINAVLETTIAEAEKTAKNLAAVLLEAKHST